MLSKNSDRISNLRSELQGVVESTAPTSLSRCVVLKGYELNRWPSMLLQAGWDYVVAHDQPGGCRAPHVLGLLLFYVLGRRVAYFISRYMANSSYVYLPLKCMGGGTSSGRAGDYTGYRVCTDYTAQCILSDVMNSWDSCTEVQRCRNMLLESIDYKKIDTFIK